MPGPSSSSQDASRSVPEPALGALAALTIFNVVLSQSFQESLFLSNHRKDQISSAMLFGSLVTAATATLSSRLLRSLSPAVALRWILIALAACAAGAALWNLHPSSRSTLALFLFAELTTTLGPAATWNYFQAPLQPSQMRRILPRLGIYSGAGGLLPMFLMPLMRRVGPPQLLVWVAAAAWLLAAFLVRTDYAPRTRRSGRAAPAGLAQVLRLPLTRWMVLGTAGIIWMGLALQFKLREIMLERMSPATIAQTMAILLAISSVIGIAVQAGLTTRILERWGVGLALAILPLAVGMLLGVYVLLPLASFAVLGAFCADKTLRPNLHRPAESCLLAALSPRTRPALYLALAGVLTPLLKAGGSAVLKALDSLHHPELLLWTAMAMTLALVAMSSRWGALYARTLRETLEEGSFEAPDAEATGLPLPLIDGPRLKILLEAVDTGSPRARELALELLGPHRQAGVTRAMQERLRHRFEAVRVAALRWLAAEPSAELQAHLRARWAEPKVSDTERIALLEAAGSGATALLHSELSRWVAAPDLELRTAVLRALLRSGEDQHQRLARRGIEALLRSLAPDERGAGLALCRERRNTEFLPLCLQLLGDSDVSVQREAVATLPSFDALEARQALWRTLGQPLLAHAGVRAMASLGVAVVPQIVAALERPGLDPNVRLHLLRTLGLLPDPSVTAYLQRDIERRDRGERLEALKALNSIRRSDPEARMEPEVLRRLVVQELQWGLKLMQSRDLLYVRLHPAGLLLRELGAQISAAQQRVSFALALLSPPETMVHIFRALRSRGSRHRDQALEFLGTLFPLKAIQAGSLKLLDESTPWTDECFRPPLDVSVGQSMEEAIDWLASTRERWMLAALEHDPDCPRTATRAGAHLLPPPEDPMMTADISLETILFLKDVALFEALTNQQLVAVARLAHKVEVPARTALFQQGDPPDYLYLVVSGKLRVVIGSQEIARLGPGECAGEMAVLAATERTATVETVDTSHLLRFDCDDFLALLDTYPEIGRALLRSLVRRLTQVQAGGTKKERPATITGMIGIR